MKKIIKITEAQLREADFEAFNYLDMEDDTKPFDGQCVISAQGKLDGEEYGEPIFTDRIGKERTPQAWARYRMYGNINQAPHARANNIDLSLLDDLEAINDLDDELDEGVAINNNVLGIDDYNEKVAKTAGLDDLADKNENNNLCTIPKGVDRYTDILIDEIKKEKLNHKQIAKVLYKFIISFPQLGENGESIKSVLRQAIDLNSIKDINS